MFFLLSLVTLKVVEIAVLWGVAANLISRVIRTDHLSDTVNAGITIAVGVVTAALLAYANSGAVFFSWAVFWSFLTSTALGMVASHSIVFQPLGIGKKIQSDVNLPVVRPVVEKLFGPKK